MGGGCLFLFSGVVCGARGNQRIVEISGLWRSHPAFAGLAFAGIASAGAVPGTVGFAGAYGFVMSSNYNSRPRAAEVMVDGDRFSVIRERETLEDLTRGEHLLPC